MIKKEIKLIKIYKNKIKQINYNKNYKNKLIKIYKNKINQINYNKNYKNK